MINIRSRRLLFVSGLKPLSLDGVTLVATRLQQPFSTATAFCSGFFMRFILPALTGLHLLTSV
jgi:hypothetical protein